MNNRASRFCMALLIGSAYPAAAEDFVITVPVHIYKAVQGVGKVKVFCEVLDDNEQRIGSQWNITNKHVNAIPGRLEEDVVLAFNANPGKVPRAATHYKCDMKLQIAWNTDQPWMTPGAGKGSYLEPKPGTPFKVEDSGPLYAQSKLKNIKAKTIQRRPN
jgi:hypothetical protein